MGAAATDRNFILERSIVGLLLLTGRLMRRENVAPIVLQSLRILLMLKHQVRNFFYHFVELSLLIKLYYSTGSISSITTNIFWLTRIVENGSGKRSHHG